MADVNSGKVVIIRDGPYMASPEIPLNQVSIQADSDGMPERWVPGRQYANPTPEQPYYLCRCGRSRDKPFCDGTHSDFGFCGQEKVDRPSYEEGAMRQAGENVTLLDNESLCVGARFCDRGETIWRLVDEASDPEKLAQAMAEAGNCPGGRLVLLDAAGTPIEPDLAREISVLEDPTFGCRGPLRVKGGIRVENADGQVYETRNRVALCRCGESKNQPFCDATHYECPHMEGLDE